MAAGTAARDDTTIQALSAARAALGALLFLVPGAVGRAWLGPAARLPATKVALRSMGARDAVLGAGALLALRRGRPVRGWLEAGAASDLADLVGTLLAGDRIPALGRVVVPMFAAAGAAGSGLLASRSTPAGGDRA